MLSKMGFKAEAGVGLGKDGTGMLEPVGVELKFNRTGLGADEGESLMINQESCVCAAGNVRICVWGMCMHVNACE